MFNVTIIALFLAIILEAVRAGIIPNVKNQIYFTKRPKSVPIKSFIGFRSGQCQNLDDENMDNPMKISFRKGRGHWELETSSQLCNDPEWRPQAVFNISRTAPQIILNGRTPIRSFQLNYPISREKPLEVTFIWNDGASSPGWSGTKLKVSDKRCISSNCGLLLARAKLWHPYSHTIRLTRNNSEQDSSSASAASIKVFSDNSCRSQISGEVRNAADLVAITRKYPKLKIVRSVRFKKIKV